MNSPVDSKRRSRDSRTRRRIVRALIAVPVLVTLCFTGWIFGHIPVIWSYDVRFAKLEMGDSVERLKAVLGRPHIVQPSRLTIGDREYLYRVYPFCVKPIAAVRTEWCVIVDKSNHIVYLQRNDGGC